MILTLFLFYFFYFSISIDYYDKGGKDHHLEPQDPSGTILVQDTIFQCFHNMYNQMGGCMYIRDISVVVKFSNLGFVDCITTKEGGALSFNCKSYQIQNTCAFLCQATNKDYQFAKIECNFEHNNNFSFLTVVSCGPNNMGKSSIGFCGTGRFYINNINSSNNKNNFDTNSYGTCFRTHSIVYIQATYVNFVNSMGYDVINTNVNENTSFIGSGIFNYGNVYNCSIKYIYIFRGVITINNFKFGKIDSSDGLFKCGSGSKTGHLLTFSNSQIDKFPTKIESNIQINGGCNLQIPIVLLSIDALGTQNCPLPTSVFTLTEVFSQSKLFTPSREFTSSITFSPSSEFTSSKIFSATSKFTSSIAFSASSKFTFSKEFSPSKKFTSSFSFSPSPKFLPSSKFTSSKKFSPSKIFSSSKKFTSSKEFSPSSKFTSSKEFSPSKNLDASNTFSPSSEFTKSTTFSESSKFTSSDHFYLTELFVELLSPTNTFTSSSPFTPSFTFKPNATKYPDGLNQFGRADVYGSHKKKQNASTAQIGATAGFSFAFIIVAVVLMVLYLRSKRNQLLKNPEDDLSDSFLHEESTNSSSYSYSYYTYSYTYGSNESSYEYFEYSNVNEIELSYSDFEGNYISLDEQY